MKARPSHLEAGLRSSNAKSVRKGPRTAARKGRRESGRSWRDYDLDEEAGAEAEAEIGSDESDFEFG